MTLVNITATDLDTANATAAKYLQRLTLQINYLNRVWNPTIWKVKDATIAEIKTEYVVACQYLDFLLNLKVITPEDYTQLSDRLCDCKQDALTRKANYAAHQARLKQVAVESRTAIEIGREMAEGDHNGHCRYAD